MAKRHTKKTRFYLTVGGIDKELFAVRERSLDQLTILLPRPSNYEIDGENMVAKEEHISVHGGTTGKSTLIKRTNVVGEQTIEGELYESALLVGNRPDGWGRAIFTRACQDLSPPRYTLQRRAKDTFVHVATFDPAKYTFVFTIVISDGAWPIAELVTPNTGLAIAKFQRYSVGVVYSFQCVPSFPHGEDSVFATSSIRKNKGEYVQLPYQEKYWPPEYIMQMCFDAMVTTALRNVERAQKRIVESGFLRMPEMDSAARYFVSSPFLEEVK